MKTHGKARTPIHNLWQNMKARCRNKNNPQYKDYGGRGITMCDEWFDSFDTFYAAVGDVPSPEHSIDRIKNNKGYEPGNVKWSTSVEQNSNKRNTVLYTHNGVTKTLTAWAQEHGLRYGCLHYRLFTKKMSFEEATTTPSNRS